MNHLFDAAGLQDTLTRIDQLKPGSQRQWGKMDVAQMMAHCSAAMEVAVGQKHPPRIFIGKILGPLVKPSFTGPKSFHKNAPTDKSFIFTDKRNFEKEKTKLVGLLKQFSEGGEAACTQHPHSFFGKLTPNEWSVGMYKHMDHHLRQFGV